MGAAVRCLFRPAIDSDGSMHYETSTQENRTRETGPALFATPVSFVRKLGRGTKPARVFRQPFYNLGTIKDFGASAPGSSPQKTGAPTRIGAAAFILNGKSLGSL